MNNTAKYRNIAIILVITAILFFLASNAMPNVENYPVEDPAGFFSGIWHGWIAPFSLIFSFFTGDGIYAVNNTGFPYDLGFYISIISGFGGLSFSRFRYSNQDIVYKYDNEV